MIIQTKYSVGDLVWYIDDNKVKSKQLACIDIICSDSIESRIQIRYSPSGSFRDYCESEIFASKEELLASL